MAQEVLAPPPEQFVQKAPVSGTSPLEAAAPSTTAEALDQGLMHWGPINLRPHLLYRFLYGGGIQSQPGQPSKTAINEISPGILFDLGTHWHLDYTAGFRFYSNSRFRDVTDHSVALDGATTYQSWSFNLSQSYSISSTPLVETGAQTDRENYATAFSANYQMSLKTTLELAVNQDFRHAKEFTDSSQWSTMDWLNYHFLPTFSAAIGAGFGYVDVSVGPDMTYEQAQGRIAWQPGTKLSVSLTGGIEDRQFLNSAAPDLIDPIFTASIQYLPFEATTIALNASRAIHTSYFESQVVASTDVSISVDQRLLGQVHANISAGYRKSSYKSTTTVASVNRQDDHRHISVRLSCPFLKHGTAAVFYHLSDNASNQSDFAYSSSQAGLELSYRY